MQDLSILTVSQTWSLAGYLLGDVVEEGMVRALEGLFTRQAPCPPHPESQGRSSELEPPRSQYSGY